MTRKIARDLVFKLLYQADMQKESTETIYSIAETENNIDQKSKDYIISTLKGIDQNSDRINTEISEKSQGWKINRMSKITLACLKLGVYEVIYNGEIPDAVAVNEAVGLAKTYEGDEAASFVNGILSVVVKEKASE